MVFGFLLVAHAQPSLAPCTTCALAIFVALHADVTNLSVS